MNKFSNTCWSISIVYPFNTRALAMVLPLFGCVYTQRDLRHQASMHRHNQRSCSTIWDSGVVLRSGGSAFPYIDWIWDITIWSQCFQVETGWKEPLLPHAAGVSCLWTHFWMSVEKRNSLHVKTESDTNSPCKLHLVWTLHYPSFMQWIQCILRKAALCQYGTFYYHNYSSLALAVVIFQTTRCFYVNPLTSDLFWQFLIIVTLQSPILFTHF